MKKVERERLIDRYVEALDTGNLEQMEVVLQAALQDGELTDMIVAVSRAFEEEKGLTPTPTERKRARRLLDERLESSVTECQEVEEGHGKGGISASSREEVLSSSEDQSARARASPHGRRSNRKSRLKSLIAEASKKGLSFPAFARWCNVGVALMRMLDRRLIKVSTIPAELIEVLSEAIDCSIGQIIEYLRGDPRFAEGAHHRADQVPELAAQQDFAEAVQQDTTMTEEQRRYWLEKAFQTS